MHKQQNLNKSAWDESHRYVYWLMLTKHPSSGLFGNRRGTFCLGFTKPGERPVRDGNNFNAQSEAEIDIIAVFTKREWWSGIRRLTGKPSSRLPVTCIHFRDVYTRCIYKCLWSILKYDGFPHPLLRIATSRQDFFQFLLLKQSGWYMNVPETTLHTNTRNVWAKEREELWKHPCFTIREPIENIDPASCI